MSSWSWSSSYDSDYKNKPRPQAYTFENLDQVNFLPKDKNFCFDRLKASERVQQRQHRQKRQVRGGEWPTVEEWSNTPTKNEVLQRIGADSCQYCGSSYAYSRDYTNEEKCPNCDDTFKKSEELGFRYPRVEEERRSAWPDYLSANEGFTGNSQPHTWERMENERAARKEEEDRLRQVEERKAKQLEELQADFYASKPTMVERPPTPEEQEPECSRCGNKLGGKKRSFFSKSTKCDRCKKMAKKSNRSKNKSQSSRRYERTYKKISKK